MLRRLLPLALMILMSCIDPIDIKLDGQNKHLVVEGYFTNEASLNYVRLSYSQPYRSPYNQFEEEAVVSVSSNEGEEFLFSYDKAGYYYPVMGREAYGKKGHTYTLNVSVGDRLYKSDPVVLQEPVPIDSIHFELSERTYAFYGEREKKLYPGYNVLVDYNDPIEEKNYYRWSFSTEYEIWTQPWDFIDPFSGEPAPKDCCIQCYLSEELQNLKVANDRLTDGKLVLNQNVLFIPFERYLGVKNKLTVYQHTITADAYNYFRILEQQKGTTGTVFDPPPAEVKGNIISVYDDNEQVLGFFDVSGVTEKEVVILKDDIDYNIIPFRFPDDCRALRGATTEAPDNW